jgi:hypothetical protein
MTQERDPDEGASVISDGGVFGRPPPLPTLQSFDEGGDDRSSLIWLLAVLATITIALWAVALSLSQATSREVAQPVAVHGIAVLTGVDALLDLHLEAVRAAAAEADDTEPIALPGYPVLGASWLAVEARTASRDTLRGLLLSRSADLVYINGVSVLAEGDGTFDGGTFSTSAGVRRVLETLSQSNHDRASAFVWPLGLIALALSIVLAISGNGFARFSVLGTTLLIGALPAIVLGAMLRAAVTLVLIGLAILVPALLLHSLFDRSIGRGRSELTRASQ